MRPLTILLLLLLTPSLIHAQTNLEQANEAYRLHDYHTAVVLYEDAINTGQRGAALFYNLGSAYYEADDMGRALYNYRRAAIYMPRDSDLNLNIARIRAQRIAAIPDETDWLNQLGGLTQDFLTLYEFSLLVFVVWIVFFVVLAIDISRKFYNANLRFVVLIIGMILLAGLLLLGSRIYIETQRPAAVVLTDGATVMSGPGTDYQPIYSIDAASEVRVMREVGEWVRFAFADGRGGWMQWHDLGYVTD